MAASHMLITTQTEARQLIRETLRGNLGCLPYARLLQGMAAPSRRRAYGRQARFPLRVSRMS